VPVPIGDSDGRTASEWRGRIWQVEPWMPGEADRSQPPSPARVAAAFRALASFHQRLASASILGQSTGLIARAAELRDLTAGGGFAELANQISAGEHDRPHALANRWQIMAQRLAPRVLDVVQRAAAHTVTLQPCLRDARPDHFLFVGDRVTGLVDFGAMDQETVAADLARMCSEWDGLDKSARATALAAYADIRPLDAREDRLIDLFEQAAAVLGAAHWIRWHFAEHRSFEDPTAVERGLARGVDRLARLTARAL
jgi:homoserine kinase type II